MATEYTYVCDRCKKHVEPSKLATVKIQKRLCVRLIFRDSKDDFWHYDPTTYEMCADCRDELDQFMKGGANKK